MAALVLYYFPGTCARVALAALEQSGLAYEHRLVRFFRGEHKRPDYLAINPKGKVPTLVVGGQPLTENVAIGQYLSRVAPDAALMPATANALADAIAWSDLIWCASTLHPIVTRLRMAPIIAGPQNAGAVWSMADEAMRPNWRLIEERLADRPWMLGDMWSLVDAFVFWLWDTAVGADVDPAPYPALSAHAGRSRAYPAMARALAAEEEAFAQFAQEGDSFALPPSAKPVQ